MAERFAHPDTPFPIGVEYYRGGAPRPEFWDEDFANIRAAGFRIVRSASYWNWMEPARDAYHLDDYDAMFDLAAKHGLSMWLDVMLATHGAAPEWMTREYPDFRVVNYRGHTFHSSSRPAYPQGGMIHCYDHPIWRERGGKLLRHVVRRYKDHPAAFVWGIWDGIGLSSQWVEQHDGYPCYCEHSIARYMAWLEANFTLDEFNARTLRRYHRWEDVEPPRSDHNVLEMLLFKRFNYENLAGHLRWMIGEVRKIDHGARDADARRVVPPSMGRDVRPLRRLVGDVDALEQPAHGRRPLPSLRPRLLVRVVAGDREGEAAGGTRRSTPACRPAA